MRFLSYFHDPDNLFVPLLESFIVPQELKGSIIAVTPETTSKVYELVDNLGFNIIRGGPYGYGKFTALKETLKDPTVDRFFVCDFDKMLHWNNTNPAEFLKMFTSEYSADLSVIARSSKALETYPTAWIETEQIVTKIMQKILGKDVDLMNGPIILNRSAAKVIVEDAKETGVGSCAEWCLLVKRAGLSLANFEVDGLTWEDPDRYTFAINKAPSFDDWKETNFDSLYEWRKRVEFLHMQLLVMIRLHEEPVNPKYPLVKNQTFS